MAKKSSTNNENTTTKQKKTTTKEKEPLISTRKKVGLAVYFTFMATLAGIIGIQILLDQNFGEQKLPTDTYSTTVVDETQTPVEPNATNQPTTSYNNYPIDENAPNHNVAEPYDNSIAPDNTSQLDNTEAQQDTTYTFDTSSPSCPNGNCNTSTNNGCIDGNCITVTTDNANCVCEENTACENGQCSEIVYQ